MPLGRLHVITHPQRDRDPLSIVAAALAAGAPVVQVRGKELTDRELYDFTCRVQDLCAAHGATCLVDDRVHIALAADAGVHVGADDLPVAVTRKLLGPEPILGATARDPATAQAHEAAGATYLGVGPCFATATRAGLPALLGVAGVRAVADAVSIPVIAIAGVTAARVPELLAAGAYGVAVIGAVWDAHDPHRAVEVLLHALGDAA